MAEQIVRCPYCTLFDEFRPMLPKPEGWFICTNCGHTAEPALLDYKCQCMHCEALRAA